ncbi:MAG: NADH:ubiquinone reductase (Na(+)-transporting) subunit D [Spirochaetales bacterium]|nr:NADH:ubiquinone reductase (Na(+)-transporting) subunit D [Spirochaetales bacterium]
MNTPSFKQVTIRNLWSENQILIQVLGICSTLAVTNNLINTSIMALGVVFTTGFSNLTISSIKTLIPRKVRMITQVLIIAFYVIVVDLVLRAFLPSVSRALGPYVGLIITNCIIMGRAEAFAQNQPPLISFWDGVTAGAGYMAVLLVVAFIRELLGFGSLYGFRVMPQGFPTWTIMLMAPSAFFILGIVIWIAKSAMGRKKKA